MVDCRVMILEDEAIIAWDMEAELQSRGITVVGVASQTDGAMTLIDTCGVTAAILDIHIGADTSYAVARTCLERHIGVIFLTGDSGEARPDDLKDLDIVPKPVDYELLLDKLRQLDPKT